MGRESPGSRGGLVLISSRSRARARVSRPVAGRSGVTVIVCGDLAQSDRAKARSGSRRRLQPILPSLRPGCRVVALGEVEEMARTRTDPPTGPTSTSTISETVPARRGPIV